MTSSRREAPAAPTVELPSPASSLISSDFPEDSTVTLHHPAPPATALAGRPAASQRVRDLLERMTLEEKLAQIVGFWDKGDGEAVAPLQGEFGGAAWAT